MEPNLPSSHYGSKGASWALAIFATLAIAFCAAMVSIHGRHYGWALFVAIPYFAGFFSTALLRLGGVQPFLPCLGLSIGVAFLLCLLFLIFGIEGMICVFMTLPLAFPLVFLGTWMAFLLFHRPAPVAPPGLLSVFLVLGLALAIWGELHLQPISPTYTVSDSVAIEAPLPVVWDSLLHLGSLGQPADLLFHLGVACPQRVDLYGTGVGAVRVCTLTTGQLHERITVWRPLHELAWVSISTPPPLQELNPFHKTDPPHLHGFYRSVSGRFELQSLGPQRTLVTRHSSYQHHLFPAAYWRIWCDYVARRGHLHVLNVLKHAAEERAPGTAPAAQRPRMALR
ncbi:MAG TPA: hypothetical protein VFE33_30640 [Thermoanaerobaculia bacterium]|nr:hypothetical protein [Thermoanaerobaculia bacterium]